MTMSAFWQIGERGASQLIDLLNELLNVAGSAIVRDVDADLEIQTLATC